METREQSKEDEKILSEVMARAENSKQKAKRLSSKKVVLATILGSMIGGAIVGEYEVVAHGAAAIMPAVTSACGAAGGVVASGIGVIVSNSQAKIDQEKVEKARAR